MKTFPLRAPRTVIGGITGALASLIMLSPPAAAQLFPGSVPQPPTVAPGAAAGAWFPSLTPVPPNTRPRPEQRDDEGHPAPFQRIQPWQPYHGQPAFGFVPNPQFPQQNSYIGTTMGRLPPDQVNVPPITWQHEGYGGFETTHPTAPIEQNSEDNDDQDENSSNGFTDNQPIDGIFGAPPVLGGYYFSGYSNQYYGQNTYQSIYSDYNGLPTYIYETAPGVVIFSQPPPQVYLAAPQPFYPPIYPVTYNQTNYYVTNSARADKIQSGGAPAATAIKQAYAANSFQAAFADIERGWNTGDIGFIKTHIRSDSAKISVFLNGSYKYSLASSDFIKITHDAFNKLNTDNFKFDLLQKAKNGDVTAYGKHTYTVIGDSSNGNGEIVPFDSHPAAYDATTGNILKKTVYVSYTLRHRTTGWCIESIDTSNKPIVQATSS